jgi:uncharacterized protein with PQ loop repeat
MRHGAHHLYLRKQKQEQPLNPKIKFLDNLVYVVSVLFPLTTLPQIIQIFSTQTATGISILTWSLYIAFSIPMLIYTIVHKVKPLIIMNILWITMYSLVVIGAILYG